MDESKDIKNWHTEGSNFSDEFSEKYGELILAMGKAVAEMTPDEVRQFVAGVAIIGAMKKARVQQEAEMAEAPWQ